MQPHPQQRILLNSEQEYGANTFSPPRAVHEIQEEQYGRDSCMGNFLYPEDGTKTNIIVNYLPQDMTQEEFAKFFERIGFIESVALMKNSDGSSKCYGFVKFEHPIDAELAVNTFDGYILDGKRLKVALARPGGPRAKCKLFVGNIPIYWTENELKYFFATFGEILEIKVLRFDHGKSRRCGFVRFDKQECALQAMYNRHGWVPPGASSALRVQIAKSNPAKQAKRVYLHNGDCVTIPKNTRDDHVPHESNVGMSPHTSRSSSSGQKFSSPKPDKPNKGPSPNNSAVSVEQSRPIELAPEDATSCALYVWNLPTFMPEDIVHKMFAKYGTLKELTLDRDAKGQNIGTCLAIFSSKPGALNAFNSLNSVTMCNKELQMRFCEPLTDGIRKSET